MLHAFWLVTFWRPQIMLGTDVPKFLPQTNEMSWQEKDQTSRIKNTHFGIFKAIKAATSIIHINILLNQHLESKHIQRKTTPCSTPTKNHMEIRDLPSKIRKKQLNSILSWVFGYPPTKNSLLEKENQFLVRKSREVLHKKRRFQVTVPCNT